MFIVYFCSVIPIGTNCVQSNPEQNTINNHSSGQVTHVMVTTSTAGSVNDNRFVIYCFLVVILFAVVISLLFVYFNIAVYQKRQQEATHKLRQQAAHHYYHHHKLGLLITVRTVHYTPQTLPQQQTQETQTPHHQNKTSYFTMSLVLFLTVEISKVCAL
jgi:hypothetical protein